MIAVADVNTNWRLRPFEALGQQVHVLGMQPMDLRVAWRQHRWLFARNAAVSISKFRRQSVLMPFRWARRPDSTCRRLFMVACVIAGKLGQAIDAMVVTSPHYQSMPEVCSQSVPVYYYCSDDYSAYAGWGGDQMIKWERNLVRRAKHSFFVSRVLAERAVRDYGVAIDRVSVSPNATDPEFLEPVDSASIAQLLEQHPNLRRPIVGVVGGINHRLDFDLLTQVVKVPQVGSLLMVGGIDRFLNDHHWNELKSHSKCVIVGERPHHELPVWMQMFDVALIPYRDNPLNRACSPMRLFDHLASGRPIVATHWCDQVHDFGDVVRTGQNVQEIIEHLHCVVCTPPNHANLQYQHAIASLNTWNVRADILMNTLCNYL